MCIPPILIRCFSTTEMKNLLGRAYLKTVQVMWKYFADLYQLQSFSNERELNDRVSNLDLPKVKAELLASS